jgi:hypothetical protein
MHVQHITTGLMQPGHDDHLGTGSHAKQAWREARQQLEPHVGRAFSALAGCLAP